LEASIPQKVSDLVCIGTHFIGKSEKNPHSDRPLGFVL
jgi:hypothetical protein